MSSDLHIHIVETEEQEKHARLYLRKNGWSSVIDGHFEWLVLYDGKWMNIDDLPNGWDENKLQDQKHIKLDLDMDVIYSTPDVWVGEVSWLKAGLTENGETKYIPNTISRVSEIVGYELPVLTQEMIDEIKKAFALENDTQYSLAPVDIVVDFLKQYVGKKVFMISW